MRPILLSLLLILPLAAEDSNAAKVYSNAKRPRALALIGDRFHSPTMMRDGLIPALVRENIPVTFLEEVTALNAQALGEHQLLIMARNGRYWPNGYDKPEARWMTDAQQKAIWDFVEKGGALLGIHNAHTAYPPGPYLKLFGGEFGGHPKPYVFSVRIENPNHPVTAGVSDFDIYDEHHMNKYALDQEHLLLRSIARDNAAAPAGWWREVGKGRFCYLSPGHTPEALSHPMMQRLLRNAMRWVLRIE